MAAVAVAIGVLVIVLLLLLTDRGCESSKPVLRDAAGARPQALSSFPGALPGALPPPPQADALPSMAGASAAPECPRGSKKGVLAVGIITAPAHLDRRLWIRQKLRVSDAHCRGVRVLFVLGRRNRMTAAQRHAVRHEERAHDDIVFVNARDWVPHAVAEKSLAWWQHAEAHIDAEWCVKITDYITARR